MGAGGVITYARLSEVLGREFLGNRTPLARATKELETVDHRTLVCVRGEGYRMAAATEHEGLVHVHSRRSRRQLKKAVEKARSANRAELSPDQARRLDALELHLSEHASMLQRLDARDREREAQIKKLRRDTTTDLAALDEKVTKLTDMLRRHGIDDSAVTAVNQG